MPSIKIKLFTGKQFNDKKHPVVLQVINDRRRKIISLGLRAHVDEWIPEIQRFSNKCKKYKTNNKLLEVYETRADETFNSIKRENKVFSFELFVSRFNNDKKSISLFNLYDEIIQEFKDAHKQSTANVYQNSQNVLKAFRDDMDASLYEVNYNFLKGYEAYLFKKGNNAGGANHHMRTLRAVINEAIRRNYLEQEYYPFSSQFKKDGYSLSHLKSTAAPRALSPDDMNKMKKFNVSKYPDLAQSYHYFMFSYYARGINFVDMAKLQKSDIYDDRLIYNRSKTSKPFNIQLNNNMKNILANFNDIEGEYIFPILSDFHKTDTQKQHRIKKRLKAYNKDLKKVAAILKLNVKITSYVARHTYATTLKRGGISTDVISEALGHSEVATTKAYLEKFSNDILDKTDDLL